MADLTKDSLFRPLTKNESKARGTDSAVKTMLKAQAVSHEAKTKRLKEARLAAEAEQAKAASLEPPVKKRTRRTKP